MRFASEDFLLWWDFEYTQNDSIILILLAGLFVLGILFGKLLSAKALEKNNENITEKTNATHSDTFIPELWEEPVTQKKSKIYSIDSEEIKIHYDDSFNYWPESHETKQEIENILLEEKTHRTNFSQTQYIEDTTMLNVAKRMKFKHKKEEKDNLQVIEWIGPKIETLLQEWWILTYRDLSQSNVDTIMDILVKAWPRYALHKPASWPKQALLAYENNFDKLEKYQETLIKWVEQD